MKRYILFFITNILIVSTISIVCHLLGLDRYVSARGLNFSSLLVFCLFWGFSGAFISLGLSRWLAKRSMGVTVIPPNTSLPEFRALLETVYELSKKAGIRTMPEVGVYESDEINAFATGPSKNRALVAVSTGLAKRMSPNQIYGVLGHEIAHIANGDMVTMTLLQGTVNSFVMFLSRILSSALTQNSRGENRYILRYYLTFVFELAFGVLGSIVVAYFSRHREYRADEGGSKLAGKANMIAALEGLLAQTELSNSFVEDTGLSTLKIYGKNNRFLQLFATHPALIDRINNLKRFD